MSVVFVSMVSGFVVVRIVAWRDGNRPSVCYGEAI